MPEAKNTFIQSKMNKDMDGRILPNGQYRDGENVQISKSEGDDVGALEVVLGNVLLTDFGLDDPNLEAIGKYFDDSTNTVFLFLTNYSDSSTNQLDNDCIAAEGVYCAIVSYNVQTNVSSILVEGNFLNFSKTHPVLGVSLLENLLFFTDNRNQPRKIDITLATPGYYVNEDQISVAKYYPYTAPLLLKYVGGSGPDAVTWESTMLDTTSEYLPIHTAAKIKSFDPANQEITIYGEHYNIKPQTPNFGVADGNLVTGFGVPADVTVDQITINVGETVITVNGTGFTNWTPAQNDILYFQFENPNYINNWPGDPEYLKEKFVRFSYRFKFDNNEYSLIAPFTQIAFIPRQDGYFIGDNVNQEVNPELLGQESETFDSTVVPFMENKVTNVELCLLAPTYSNDHEVSMNWNEVNSRLKITEVDILIKEASTNNVYIVDTLTGGDLEVNDKYLYYNYQSKKPWKVVPTNQVTRVSDVVPIRAKAQEISGNRVMYANYIATNASPDRLDYFLTVGQKPYIPAWNDLNVKEQQEYVRKEYQNNTLKQNRTYQVGVVLSDRYGRQSNVILSDLLAEDAGGAKNSTIFHNYKNKEDLIILDQTYATPSLPAPDTWPGDLLSIVFRNVIPKQRTEEGYPGVYSINDGSLEQVIINQAQTDVLPFNACCQTFIHTGLTYDPAINGTAEVIFCTDGSGNINEVTIVDSNNLWTEGARWKVDWTQQGQLPCPGFIGQDIEGNAVCPVDNPLGWYSYKIVVKQTEQEYYNVYLPTALAGYPCDQNPSADIGTDPEFGVTPRIIYPVGQETKTSHLVLLGDNINKVPRDLNEVGPEQKEFRSSERLFTRVESIMYDVNGVMQFTSQPYNPNPSGDKVITISNMSKLDLGNLITNPSYPILPNLLYKADTDPFIARISTKKQLGVIAGDTLNPCLIQFQKDIGTPPNTDIKVEVFNTEYTYGPTLTVCETKPVESLLDIFWETSTSGLISELNFNIENTDNTAPAGLSPVDISWSEGDDYGTVISGTFTAVGPTGLSLGSDSNIQLISVFRADAPSSNVVDKFELVQLGNGEVELKIAPASATNNGFLRWQDLTKTKFTFNFEITRISTGSVATAQLPGFVSNTEPNERLESSDVVPGVPLSWTQIKDSICSRTSNLNSQLLRETAQIMSLKAVEGTQKYGITFTGGSSIENTCTPWQQYVAPESAFPDGNLNYGIIKPTVDSYINAEPYFQNTAGLPTYYDNGDVRIMGQLDFGWFGGPTEPGTSCAKDGDNEFSDYVPFQPGTPDNSYGYSQKIYAPTNDSKYSQSNPYYPSVDDVNNYEAKRPHYMRACGSAIGGQDYIVFPTEVTFQNEVETGNPNPSEWDGTFAAANGSYGSVKPLQQWPTVNGVDIGIGTNLEVQWTIPRMYQVSMMIPHGNNFLDNANVGACFSTLQDLGILGGGPIKFPADFAYASCVQASSNDAGFGSNYVNEWLSQMPPRIEALVSVAVTTGGRYFDVQPAGEVIFGLYPQNQIPNNPAERNHILKYLPKGPIYWDANPSDFPNQTPRLGSQGTSQMDPTLNGENIVGAKYNTYTTAGLDYPHHYWPDINGLLQNEAAYANFRNNPTFANAPDFMKLRHGANTFYQWNNNHADWNIEYVCGDSYTFGGFPYFNSAVKVCGHWAPTNIQAKNALDHLFYLGGINNAGIGNPQNQQTFYAQEVPGSSTIGEDKPAKAFLHAGDPNSNSQVWSGPNSQGNGLPGGRYVVTLRATDVNGDGSFVEWDIPVYLPWWKTRTNSPLRLDCN